MGGESGNAGVVQMAKGARLGAKMLDSCAMMLISRYGPKAIGIQRAAVKICMAFRMCHCKYADIKGSDKEAFREKMPKCVVDLSVLSFKLNPKLKPEETSYGIFSHKMFAIYLGIRHLRHLLEGSSFHVLTDHRPLTFALRGNHNSYIARDIRHLNCIYEFTKDVRYIEGPVNAATDVLSRINATSAPTLEFEEISAVELTDV
ncbi:hypothetical protein MRX96_020796 [Rhipicephalus microplus]